ncbi:YifB family Mg chelatase-like AAA ATPase [Bacillus coreaensis]
MIGPPGCGKSMIAKRIPTILPEMSEKESLEVTKIYSIASMLHEKGTLITQRPFRAPHHNASTNSLIGGGPFAKPGEISFAHNGVLFLDEIAEFSRKTLDALRQPLEDQMVTITRVWGSNSYPANFMLVGAMNPCPCGYFGNEKCRCTDYEIIKYRQRLSGPIMDRMDIQKYVNNVNFFSNVLPSKSSAELKARVDNARKIQEKRYKYISGISSNAQLTASLITQFCPLDSETTSLLQKAYDRFKYSGRSLHKFIKVARTIADLEGEEKINSNNMRVSLQSRDLDKDAFHLFGGGHG